MEIQNAVKIFTDFPISFAEGFKNSFNNFMQLADGQHFKVIFAHLMVGVALFFIVLIINSFIRRSNI